MPTFRHPCPYCDKLIDKVVAACPYCGRVDPFAPKRCQSCRKIVEDPGWVVCPACGASLTIVVAAAAGAGSGAASGGIAAGQTAPQQAAPPAATPAPAQPQAAMPAPPAGKCAGCGAPLPSGARFCTICGTMAG